jgi:thiamine phosphate synthase YjbQ (UPF0047 family)
MAEPLRIGTTIRGRVVDLNDQIEVVIRLAKMQQGFCSLFVTSTAAALTMVV